jgi:hypothetical protein
VPPSEENLVVELEDDPEEEKGESSVHQSNPAKDPPNPTVPILLKSTWGRLEGAGVAAIPIVAARESAMGIMRWLKVDMLTVVVGELSELEEQYRPMRWILVVRVVS